MTLERIRAEVERETIGPVILGEVVAIATRTVRRYDPRTYGGVSAWTDGIDDLVQEVILERLLAEGQLAYAVTVAVDIEHWRNLVARQVRRTLARRRQRSVVDNLLERAVARLGAPPFETRGAGTAADHAIAGRMAADRRPTDAELRAATAAAARVPVAPGRGDERAPMVYSAAALEALLIAVATALPCRFARADLDRILRALLTQWLIADLGDIDGALQLPSERLGPEEAVEVDDLVRRVLTSAGVEGRAILRAKLDDMSDGELAGLLGLSRPTVALRKHRVLDVLRAELADSSPRVRDAVVESLDVALRDKRWSES